MNEIKKKIIYIFVFYICEFMQISYKQCVQKKKTILTTSRKILITKKNFCRNIQIKNTQNTKYYIFIID